MHEIPDDSADTWQQLGVADVQTGRVLVKVEQVVEHLQSIRFTIYCNDYYQEVIINLYSE